MERERGQTNDAVGEGEEKEQTLLLLTPFTTNAPVTGGDLADYLQEASPYRPFAQHLQSVREAVSRKETWGGVVPALTVLQGGLENVYSRNYRNSKTGKLLPSISHSMVEYISAFKFYDSLARIECQERISRDVLKQPQRFGYIGDQRHMNGVSNLRKLVEDVLKAGDAYSQLVSTPATTSTESQRTTTPATGNSDPLFMIARQLADVSSAKGALKIIRNLSAVALSIRVLMQGTCLSLPDSYEALVQKLPTNLRPSTPSQKEELAAATADPRGLRQAFYLAVLISPLLAVLTATELQKYPVCFEEILVNSKRIGNEKPLVISRLEDQVLVELLRVAEGGQTSISAFMNLYRSWKRSPPEFTLEENGFFDRPQSMEKSRITREVSVFETPAVVPYPEAWPLSQKGWSFVRAETALPSSQVPTASSSTTTQDPKGKGRERPRGAHEEAQANLAREGERGPESGCSNREDVTAGLNPGDADAGAAGASDDEDRTINDQNENDSSKSGTNGMDVDLEFPRRSNRERKHRQPSPGPSTSKPRKPKGQKSSGKRQREPEATNEEKDDPKVDVVPAIHQVHAKGVKMRKAILADALVRMEAVEPPLVSEVEDGTLPLNVNEEVTRYSDQETYMFDVWDAEGGKEVTKLESHLESDFRSWVTIIEAVKAQHCESGRPRFLDDPDNSVLGIVPKSNYAPGFANFVQHAFRKQCLVVPKYVDRDRASSFDREGLEEVCDIQHKTAVQDFSAPESHNLNDRVRLGKLEDLYKTSVAPDRTRKILNALWFPQANGQIDHKDPIASDSWAWFRTKDDLHCLKQLPTADMRWHIVGTTGASHYFHVDPRGDGTFILVRVGLKAWVLAAPVDESVMFSAELWTKMERDITKLDFTKWKVEMILLRPGDLLLQWPHVSHAVYTPLHAICWGGHFIAAATLRRTLLGMVHTFFCSGITNVDHPTFTGRINTLVSFFYKTLTVDIDSISSADKAHLPDIYSESGVVDLLLLACVVEVQNALCPLSYNFTDDPSLLALLDKQGHTPLAALADYDISGMTHEMRLQNLYSRGRMQALLRHIFDRRITIRKPCGEEMRDPWGQLFIPTFAWFINCLKTYLNLSLASTRETHLGKKRIRDQAPPASLGPVPVDSGVSFRALFKVQMRSSSLRWEPLTDAVKKLQDKHKAPDSKIKTLLPPDIQTSFTVAKKIQATGPELDGPPQANFRELGARTLDSTYFTKYAQLVGFDVSPAGDRTSPDIQHAAPEGDHEESTRRKRQRVGTAV